MMKIQDHYRPVSLLSGVETLTSFLETSTKKWEASLFVATPAGDTQLQPYIEEPQHKNMKINVCLYL